MYFIYVIYIALGFPKFMQEAILIEKNWIDSRAMWHVGPSSWNHKSTAFISYDLDESRKSPDRSLLAFIALPEKECDNTLQMHSFLNIHAGIFLARNPISLWLNEIMMNLVTQDDESRAVTA